MADRPDHQEVPVDATLPAPDYEDDDPIGAVTVSRKVVFIALGGMAIAAVLLAVLRKAMEAQVRAGGFDLPEGADWATSLKHLADGFDQRTTLMASAVQNIDMRLSALEELLTAPANGTAPSVQTIRTPDVPPPPVSVAQPAPTGEDVGPPPPPAAVSL